MKRKTPSELRKEQFQRQKSLATSQSSQGRAHNGGLSLQETRKKVNPLLGLLPDVGEDHPHSVKENGSALQTGAEVRGQVPEVSHHDLQADALPNGNTRPWPTADGCAVERHSHPPLAQAPPRGQQTASQRTKLKSIAEVATARSIPRPAGGLPPDFAAALRDISSAHVAAVGGGAAGPGAAPAPSARLALPDTLSFQGAQPPLDWSLKTTARFTAREPFDWCCSLSPGEECCGVQSFVGCAGALPALSAAAAFRRALHSWVYPSQALAPALVSAMSRQAGRPYAPESTFLAQRWTLWQEAFRSLFFSLRHQACPVFYCCTAEFVAMFQGAGLAGNSSEGFSVLLTRSTKGLRKRFRDHGLHYSLPCAGPMAAADAATAPEEELPPGLGDGSVDSLLLFTGEEDVHGLFDLLLNIRSELGLTGDLDVPLLLAPTPFTNATLQAPQVQSSSMSSLAGQAQRYATVHALDLKANLIAPWVISRLCTVFQDSQKGGFEASLSTHALSHRLNVCPSAGPGKAANGRLPTGALHGCVSEAEALSWRRPWGLDQAVIKHLTFSNNTYSAALNRTAL